MAIQFVSTAKRLESVSRKYKRCLGNMGNISIFHNDTIGVK